MAVNVQQQQRLSQQLESVKAQRAEIAAARTKAEAFQPKVNLTQQQLRTAQQRGQGLRTMQTARQVQAERFKAKGQALQEIGTAEQQVQASEKEMVSYLSTPSGIKQYAQEEGITPEPIYGKLGKGYAQEVVAYRYKTPYGEFTDYSPQQEAQAREQGVVREQLGNLTPTEFAIFGKSYIKQAQEKAGAELQSWQQANPTEKLVFNKQGQVTGVESGIFQKSMSIDAYNKAVGIQQTKQQFLSTMVTPLSSPNIPLQMTPYNKDLIYKTPEKIIGTPQKVTIGGQVGQVQLPPTQISSSLGEFLLLQTPTNIITEGIPTFASYIGKKNVEGTQKLFKTFGYTGLQTYEKQKFEIPNALGSGQLFTQTGTNAFGIATYTPEKRISKDYGMITPLTSFQPQMTTPEKRISIPISKPFEGGTIIGGVPEKYVLGKKIFTPESISSVKGKVSEVGINLFGFGAASTFSPLLVEAAFVQHGTGKIIYGKTPEEKIGGGIELVIGGTGLFTRYVVPKIVPQTITTETTIKIPARELNFIMTQEKGLYKTGEKTLTQWDILGSGTSGGVGRQVTVTKTGWFRLGKKTIYEGNPFTDKAGYQKALSLLQNSYTVEGWQGLRTASPTLKQAKQILRQQRPLIQQMDFIGRGRALYKGDNENIKVIGTANIKPVPSGTFIPSRKFEPLAYNIKQPAKIVGYSERGSPIYYSKPKVTKVFVTSKGYQFSKMSQAGKTTEQFAQFSMPKQLQSGTTLMFGGRERPLSLSQEVSISQKINPFKRRISKSTSKIYAIEEPQPTIIEVTPMVDITGAKVTKVIKAEVPKVKTIESYTKKDYQRLKQSLESIYGKIETNKPTTTTPTISTGLEKETKQINIDTLKPFVPVKEQKLIKTPELTKVKETKLLGSFGLGVLEGRLGKTIEKTKTQEKLKTGLEGGQITGTVPVERVKPFEGVLIGGKEKGKEGESTAFKFIEKVDTAQIQKLTQKLEQQQVTVPITIQKQTPTPPKPPTLTTKFKPSFGFVALKSQPLRTSTSRQAYNVLVRRFGAWQTIAKGQTKGRAELLGSKEAMRSLARSFKLEAKGTTEREEIIFQVPTAIFRTGKREQGVYVQRTKFALSSPTEKSEIQMFKRQKQRRFKL